MTTSKSQSILFFTPYGEWRVHNQVDVTVAAAMRARNCQISFVTCDGLYQPCASTRGERDCVHCQKTMGDTLAPYGFSSRMLGSLILPSDTWRADAWVAELTDKERATACFEELPIGEWVSSTAMTHFRVSQVGQLLDLRAAPVLRCFVRDTLLTYWAINRVLERENFDALFLFNGRFYPYRAAFEAARFRGIRTLVHERGRIGNSFAFFENETCFGLDTARGLTSAWSDAPLNGSEIKKIDEYFSELLLGRSSSWPAFYSSIRHLDARSVLDIPENARLIGFFTSSLDELAHASRYGEPKKQFELIKTLARALEGTNIYLVVRHHPHIAGSLSPPEVTSFDEVYLQTLCRHGNVRIVMPSDNFTSYALFPFLTAAIAPFSSIAMEMTAFGIPTLVSNVSEAAFDERFVLSDWSAPAVATALDFITSSQAHLQAEDLHRFYRKVYSVLFRFSVSFNVIGIRDYFHPASELASLEELLPGQDPALDRVCEHFLVGRPVYEYPGERDQFRSGAEEDRFIREKLDVFAKRRKELDTQTAGMSPERAAVNSFAVVIDETIDGHVESGIWKRLPNSGALSIKRLNHPHLQSWLKEALVFWGTRKADREFVAWAFGLRRLLRRTTEEYVLVSNPRFQFHDTSIAVIAEAVRSAANTELPIVVMTGWVRDPDQFFPLQLQPVKAPVAYWRDVCARLGGALRPQDTLASIVVRRDWLIKCLNMKKSATAFEDSLFDAVTGHETEIIVTQPVFLLR